MLAFTLALVLQATPPPAAARDTLRTSADSATLDSLRTARAHRLEAVQVVAIRGGAAPISEKTLGRAEIQRRYTGQETPILLQAAPGITAYSESGSASNYSYMRLRGIDQTRINITLDGIPLNEPEDQGLFFSNFPDFANSIGSVQVQRGVGSSTHGVASYAGSVNFESVPVAGVARGAEVQLTRGSYRSSRLTGSWQSGLRHGFAGYARASAQRTDGFRYNSGNRSHGGFASGGWFGDRNVVKASVLFGVSSNEQAYLASPLSVLRRTPRDNPYGNGAADAVDDRFRQALVSVAWTRALSDRSSVATTAYGFDAGGWYDVPSGTGDPDAAFNYNLRSRWGGIISALDWNGDASTATVGFHVSRYHRDHWLLLRPDLTTRAYDNTGYKGEQSVFAKGSLTRGRTTLFGDLQLRTARFRYRPDEATGTSPAAVRWAFFNPKVGASLRATDRLTTYAAVGMNGREPTRADMFAGADDVDSISARSLLPLTRVRAESVRDIESGFIWRGAAFRVQANLFVMQFRDEIAPIGGINEIGYVLRKNVPRSVRRGVEGDLTWRIAPRLGIVATASITDARIRDYRDDATGIDYQDVAALMTPRLVSGHGVRADLASWFSLDVDGRYTSRMMLTNTNDARFVVPASWYADAGATVRMGRHSVLVQLRNVLDRRVYTGGYPGPAANSEDPGAMEPYYYSLAPRNISVNARLTF